MVNRWASTRSWTAAVFLLISRSAHTATRTTYSASGTTVLTANQLRILEALQRLRIARTEGDIDQELVANTRMDELLDREPLFFE